MLDLGVWLVVIPLVFTGLLIINQGEVRFYVFLALLTGGGLYMIYLKPPLSRPVGWAAFYTAKSVSAVLSVLSLPWRLIKSRSKTPSPPEDEQ